MRIVILTEGGASKGLGHVARAVAVCEGFKERGIKCDVMVDTDVNLAEFFQGMIYYHHQWISSVETIKHLTCGADIVVFDSYFASVKVCEVVSQHARLAVFFDDFNRINYPKGFVFNAGVSISTKIYPQVFGVKYFFGSLFTPLRREFWDIEPHPIRQEIKKVFVIFGGVDKRRFMLKIMNCLLDKFSGFEYSIVVGSAFNDDSSFERMVKHASVKIYRSLSAKQIFELMREADVAISAAGQTICELARFGLPTVGVLTAENQRFQLRTMIDSDFAVDGGCADDSNVLAQIVCGLGQLSSVNERRRRSSAGRRLIDGQGVRRCVDVILKEMERI